MTVINDVEAEVEIKSSAEKFIGIWKDKPYEIPLAAPDKIQSLELQEGEWGKVGSVLYTTYIFNGTARSCIEKVEEIDEENHSITFKKTGGDVMKNLKSFKATLKCIPNGNGGCVVQWLREYEFLNAGIPTTNPKNKDEFALDLVKKIDAYLLKA